MCLAALDWNSREYDLQEMIKIFGAKAVYDVLLQYGAKYGLAECADIRSVALRGRTESIAPRAAL